MFAICEKSTIWSNTENCSPHGIRMISGKRHTPSDHSTWFFYISLSQKPQNHTAKTAKSAKPVEGCRGFSPDCPSCWSHRPDLKAWNSRARSSFGRCPPHQNTNATRKGRKLPELHQTLNVCPWSCSWMENRINEYEWIISTMKHQKPVWPKLLCVNARISLHDTIPPPQRNKSWYCAAPAPYNDQNGSGPSANIGTPFESRGLM